MKKITVLLALGLLLAALTPAGYAAETEAAEETTQETAAREEQDEGGATSGTCGDGLTWSLEGSTLTVSGSGEMDAGAPWEDHKESIRTLVFTGGVTLVGEEAFKDCDNLTEIDFGDAMREIDTRAFQDCDNLKAIYLPDTFRRFGVESFHDCDSLTTVYCTGGMPSFNSSCLWNGNEIVIYTPLESPWPQKSVVELVYNFHGRLEIIQTSREDMAEAFAEDGGEVTVRETTEPTTEPTTAPTTEPATEPTEAPTTVPVTIPATEAPTEPVTQPTTQPTMPTFAEPETQAETAAAAQPPAVQDERVSNGLIWVLLIVGGLSVLTAAGLIIRKIWHSDEDYDD